METHSHVDGYKMIIPGSVAILRRVITNLPSAELQTQPCGIDLTLKHIMQWSSPGTIDFVNTLRKTAQTVEIPIRPLSEPTCTTAGMSRLLHESTQTPDRNLQSPNEYVDICCRAYLVEFNELAEMPLDLMGQILV